MIRRTLNPRSAGFTPTFSRNRAFSLVEVMMSVVLLAIGAALAIPSYRVMVEKQQVTKGAEQLASFVNTAREYAMETDQVVTVSYSHSGYDDWCIGAVAAETACDCAETDTRASGYCRLAARPFILNASHTGDFDLMHTMVGDGAYGVDPASGQFLDPDDSLRVELRSPKDEFRLNMTLDSAGRAVVCSGDSSHSVPGYETCPLPKEPSS